MSDLIRRPKSVKPLASSISSGMRRAALRKRPSMGSGSHGEQSVGSHGCLGLGELVCELDLGEIDRGDDVLVNLGGHLDGSLVVCRGRRVEGAGADKGVDALV